MGKYSDRQIEMLIGRMKRRQVQSATIHVPPIPISMSILIPESSGLIGTTYLPATGRITRVIGQVDRVLDNITPTVVIRLESNSLDVTKSFPLMVGKPVTYDEEILVNAGTKLYVVVGDPGSVRGIWLSLLYAVELSSTEQYQIALDDLLANIETDEE